MQILKEERMTVGEIFEVETRLIARYLGCNEEELVNEMNQLFKKCVDLIGYDKK